MQKLRSTLQAGLIFEGTTKSVARLYHQHNQLKHVMDDVTVTSLSASLQYMISAAADRPRQIVLHRKISHIVYVKLRKTKNYHLK
jgi:hypothetical protein